MRTSAIFAGPANPLAGLANRDAANFAGSVLTPTTSGNLGNERERRPQRDHAMKWRNRIAQGFWVRQSKARPEGAAEDASCVMRWFEIGADVLQTFARQEDPVVVDPHPESAALSGRIQVVNFPRAKALGYAV